MLDNPSEVPALQRLRRVFGEAEPDGGMPPPSVGRTAEVGRVPGAADEMGDLDPELPPAGETPAATARPLGGPGVFDPGRRGVRALAVVAVLVVVVAAFLAWRARPQAEAVPQPAAPPREAGPAVTPSAGTDSGVVVAVTGKVRRPGLVRLPAGARVADAINAAGGVLPGTDVSLLNLARKVTDGELIVVGPAAGAGAVGGPQPSVPDGGPGGLPGGKVNLNTATLAQLDALPGVGPVLAQRILDHRQKHGAFRSVAELRQVDGIGAARFDQLKDLVTV